MKNQNNATQENKGGAVATGASTEQLLLSSLFDNLSKVAMVGLLVTFVLYMMDKPKALVSAKIVSHFWGLRVGAYLKTVHLGTGWAWACHLGHSDMLAFAAIAFLCLISAICYATMVFVFLKKKDTIYAVLSTGIVAVLLVAASGILSRGH